MEKEPKFKAGDKVMITSSRISVITELPKNTKVKDKDGVYKYSFIDKTIIGDEVDEKDICLVTVK